MIVKMKFLSISGPRIDIDRVCEKYLSKYEMQLENAVTELKTTDNLLPFVEVNPYKDALAKAEQFAALLPEGMPHVDQNMSKDEGSAAPGSVCGPLPWEGGRMPLFFSRVYS